MRLPRPPSRDSLHAVQATTEYGMVEGFRSIHKGFESDVFLGIPYASPPIGELRFRKPVPPSPWEGVKKCRRFGARSIQKDMFWDKVIIQTPQSEDCLYLNVFAPSTVTDGKGLPVLFYIHGGGFLMDSAAKYGHKELGQQIVSKDVVVVTIQYRLGYLGYFSLHNDICKGNFGLWDQKAALEWTKRNIASFGGDPSRITVGGQSAGGVSADLLSLSPLSRDLFSQKIVMGGSSFCHWAVTRGEDIEEYCRKKARRLGWKTKDKVFSSRAEEDEALMSFLRSVPAHKFACHMIGTSEVFSEARLPLAPVIDGEILPKELHELRMEAPPKRSISGVGEYEALLFVALGTIRCNGKFLHRIVNTMTRKAKGASMREVREGIEQIYGEEKRMGRKEMARLTVTLLSDLISNYACWQYMNEAERHDRETYMYSFDFTSRNMWGWMKAVLPFCERRGTHASELIYLFKCNYFCAPLPMDRNDRSVAAITSLLWANFIKSGNPNSCESREAGVQWEPLRGDGHCLLSISTRCETRREVFGGRMEALDGLFHRMAIDTDYNIATPQPRISIPIR